MTKTVTTTKKKSPPAAIARRTPLAPEPPAPAVDGTADDVALHRGAAAAVPLAAVLAYNADPFLAHHNAMLGRDALLAARAELDATGFRTDWARVESIQSLGRAVAYAASRVEANPLDSHEVVELLREARPLRALLLANAQTQALVGRVSPAEVARIEHGRGAIDAATDLLDLVVLHAERELAGSGSAVTAAQLRRAKVLGTLLREKVRPAGARGHSRRTPAQLDAMALRDRLWTLLVHAHAHLEHAAGALWGRDLGLHVPKLQGRYVPRKRAKKPAAPAAPTE